MSDLRARDAVVLAFVRTCIQREGYAPTIKEIATGTFFSTSSVVAALDVLEARGLLLRDRNPDTDRVKARRLRLPPLERDEP